MNYETLSTPALTALRNALANQRDRQERETIDGAQRWAMLNGRVNLANRILWSR